MNKIKNYCLSALALICTQVQAAPILQVENVLQVENGIQIEKGILVGAKHVAVGSKFYDVTFVDGACIALFNGCNSPANFAINTESEAQLASHALIDQVFVDGPAGQFDLYPNLIRGCSYDQLCLAVTPYGTLPWVYGEAIYASWAYSYGLVHSDNDYVPDVGGLAFYNVQDTSFNSSTPPYSLPGFYITFARWSESTPEPSSVPEPSMLALLSTGLLGGLVVRRKSN